MLNCMRCSSVNMILPSVKLLKTLLCMAKTYKTDDKLTGVNEDDSAMRFYSSQEEQELQRLKEDMSQSYTEKFRSFVRMMKLGNLLKRAIIHHKS